MATLRIGWNLSATRNDEAKTPVEPDEVLESVVFISADGGNSFSEVARIPADAEIPNRFEQPELEIGRWFVQVQCIPKRGGISPPLEGSIRLFGTQEPPELAAPTGLVLEERF